MGHHPDTDTATVIASVASAVVSEARTSLRAEHKNLTRNRVLDGAVSIFTEKSFVDATMEDIARAAGVTRVTVYAHFGGKGEIIQALADRLYDIGDEVYADLAAMPVWTRPAIRSWLDGAAARWREMAPAIRVLTAAASTAVSDTNNARERYHAAHERYAAMLTGDSGRWQGVSPAEARQRVLMAVLQVESFLSIWIAGEWPLDTDDPLDLLTDAMCHLLGPALR